MKHAFSEFARLNEREFQDFLNNAIIIFDTNVLLHLYLFSSQTLKQVFSMLSDIKDQLWMPHKVGEEFYHNRAGQIEFLKTQANAIFDDLDHNLQKSYRNFCFYEELEKGITELKNKIKRVVETHKKQYDKDEIADKLEDLFEGNVGKKYSPEKCTELEKQYCENMKNNKNCPGGEDSKKTVNFAGDYIIWNQIIDEAKRVNKNVIFVTDDQKKDWWQMVSKQPVAPQPRLLTEFKERTGEKNIRIYSLDGFITLYNKYKTRKFDKSATQEIKDKVSINDQLLKALHSISYSQKPNPLGSSSLAELLNNDSFNSARKLNEMVKRVTSPLPQISDDMIKKLFSNVYGNDNNKCEQ